MNDRLFLWLAVAFYAGSVGLTLRRLKSAAPLEGAHRINLALMVCGFALHTAFLYLRGHEISRCPLTNLFEVQAFVAWAAVLFYLLIGMAYRVSFLGAFTAPWAMAICLAGLIVPVDVRAAEPILRSAWIEFHAAIAIVACGAFGLATVGSVMYLRQEHQLKNKRLTPSFLLMPSIQQLDVIQWRLMVTGFVLLTVGMIGGFVSYRMGGHWTVIKIIWASVIWLAYGGWLAARGAGWMHGRKAAWAVMALFVSMLGGYWIVELIAK